MEKVEKKFMKKFLDQKWRQMRGSQIAGVPTFFSSINYWGWGGG
jgi:hypothetical protein